MIATASESQATMTRVLLIDDHVLVRESLARRLEDEPDLSVPQTAGTADEGLEMAMADGYHVVVMDINMPGMSCFEAARRMKEKQRDLPLVFLSAFWNDAFIDQATGVGAVGMLSKSEEPERLIQAIRVVVDGGVFFSEEVRDRISVESSSPNDLSDIRTRLQLLTPREIDVLRSVGMGKSRKQIGASLGISDNTVAVHTNRIMRKLDIHDRVGLARFAIKCGLSPL
ncbi:MAG: response regulator transcription factor [Planctomycetota bacterium]